MAKKYYTIDEIVFVELKIYPRTQNLSNCVFDRLTVLGYAGKSNCNRNQWFAKCICSKIVKVLGHDLNSGKTLSCGCLNSEIVTKRSFKHGSGRKGKESVEYQTWLNIKKRCYCATDPRYKDYGGRGITVFESWKDNFNLFYKYIGDRPSDKHSIDRINIDGNYEPGNVRWSTNVIQCNNKRNNKFLTFCEKTQTYSEWARELKLSPSVISSRIRAGWCTECALFSPKNYSCIHKLSK